MSVTGWIIVAVVAFVVIMQMQAQPVAVVPTSIAGAGGSIPPGPTTPNYSETLAQIQTFPGQVQAALAQRLGWFSSNPGSSAAIVNRTTTATAAPAKVLPFVPVATMGGTRLRIGGLK